MNMDTSMLMTLMALASTRLSMADAQSTSTRCADASTLVLDTTDRVQAIAFTADCFPRPYKVDTLPDGVRSLNVSNLQLTTVTTYPEATKLLLYNNELTSFRSQGAVDDSMDELNLQGNKIKDLSDVVFPRRLTKLNLAFNNLKLLTSPVPWPASMDLKWLALDSNNFTNVSADAFSPLTSLQYLSLSSSTLDNLSGLALPASLTILNLSGNQFTSSTFNFSAPLTALTKLDVSANKLTQFPDLAAFTALTELNLAANTLTSISGVRLPPKLKIIDLTDNNMDMIEIAQSDVKIVEQADVILPTFTIITSCKNPKAELQTLASDLVVCVLSDAAFNASYNKGAQSSAATPPVSSDSSRNKDSSTLNNPDSTTGSSSGNSSHLSSKAMLLLGLGSFGMGLLVAAFVFLVRREKSSKHKPPHTATFAPEVSSGSSCPYVDPDESYRDASWIFESPRKTGNETVGANNVVAILEDDRRQRGRSRNKVEDLLVYEIPLDEIRIKELLVQKGHGGEAMFQADYQEFQVVMHALMTGRNKLHRGKRRYEREFVEQVRLASSLEHLCIVQFIGVTFGSTSNTPQGQPYKWKMGVVFEYMQCGSLAAIFHEERTRREGKLYSQTTPLGSSKNKLQSSGGQSTFSWYPGPQTSAGASQRYKMAVALDVAMGLVYLHSLDYFHGDLRAEKVLVNELGEAKLSGMDINLQLNTASSPPLRGDLRASAVKARMKVMQVFQNTSISKSPALHSPLLSSQEQAAANASSSMMSSQMLTSANTRARRKGMQCDVYAFGLLLWELDTLMCVETMKRLTAATTERGEEHHMLRFSTECPSEIQFLARRCWHPDVKKRPSALDLQEELVRLLEGRLTRMSERSVSSSVMQGGNRWSRHTASSHNNGSSTSFASSGHSLGSSRSQSLSEFGLSSLVISETEV